MLNFPCENFP